MNPILNVTTYPFHTVTRGDLTEHSAVTQKVDIGGITEFWVVCSGTEVKFAIGYGNVVKSSSSCRDWSGSGCGRASWWWRVSLSKSQGQKLKRSFIQNVELTLWRHWE